MSIGLENGESFIWQEEILSEYGRIRAISCFDNALYISTNNKDGIGNPLESDYKILKITPIKIFT